MRNIGANGVLLSISLFFFIVFLSMWGSCCFHFANLAIFSCRSAPCSALSQLAYDCRFSSSTHQRSQVLAICSSKNDFGLGCIPHPNLKFSFHARWRFLAYFYVFRSRSAKAQSSQSKNTRGRIQRKLVSPIESALSLPVQVSHARMGHI